MIKATLVMIVWSTAVGYGLWELGVQNHIPSGVMWGQEPMWMSILWSFGAALALLIALMVNVVIFARVAGDEAWQWFKR